jgi:hypothetical protein
MVNTVGRIIKLEQGCRLRKIDFEWLKKELTQLGYTIKEDES